MTSETNLFYEEELAQSRAAAHALAKHRKTYTVLLAYDVPYYSQVTVEAHTQEEARRKAIEEADEASFDAGWDAASDTRVVDVSWEGSDA